MGQDERLTHGAAWVRSPDDDDEDDEADAQANLLPKSPRQPPEAQIAHHNHTPAFLLKSKPEPGRLHDAQRESIPPTPRYHVSELASRWRKFAEWSALPKEHDEQAEQVTEDWLVQHGPDYSQAWHTAAEEEGLREEKWRSKRKAWYKRAQRTVLRNPFIPLVFRLIVAVFSTIALALGANVYPILRSIQQSVQTSQSDTSCPAFQATSTTSPVMAIVVDAVAIIYLILITRDEYAGQPLGLRTPRSKVRLILLDLFFIVFDSANLSLAFEAVSSFSQPCSSNLKNLGINSRTLGLKQDALASVLLVALITWLMTFAISILR